MMQKGDKVRFNGTEADLRDKYYVFQRNIPFVFEKIGTVRDIVPICKNSIGVMYEGLRPPIFFSEEALEVVNDELDELKEKIKHYLYYDPTAQTSERIRALLDIITSIERDGKHV